MKRCTWTLSCLLLALMLGGCAILDSLEQYKYIGIYDDYNKDERLSAHEYDRRFDRFLTLLAAKTGSSIETDLPDRSTALITLVPPGGHWASVDRVVLELDEGSEISMSIIKETKGEDEEVVKLKHAIENCFRKVGLSHWRFYVQRSYGQLWNN